ncbi:hypothetical protein [Spongiimicrobium salis]|uniref:hypothetical protein n=1 Tax=Spongiimicrobium salis TaxID=1667022 RepID=UPI00374D9696
MKEVRPRMSEELYKEFLKFKQGHETVPNDYGKKPFVMSAWGDDGKMMCIDKYCEHYNLPRASISSYKLVSHTGTPYYNIVFRENLEENSIDIQHIKNVLKEEISTIYFYKSKEYVLAKETVLKWADLHFGAHIRNLLLTKDYDSTILRESLIRSVYETNRLGHKKIHVHIMGDLIESFSGLNHINSWMSLDKEEIGPMAIKLCCKLLHEVLSEIDNLGCIKIVAGNHDRTSKANDEDVKGGAAELIAWGLQLMGYDVEFHPYIITHLVEGINHINLHGDKGISKKSTEDILWKYGKKGVFNFIFEAHLHSIIEKLTVAQRKNFKTIKDDGLDHRRMHCPSFFTGNYYSETLGYNSNSGYLRISDNGIGLPDVHMMAI